MKEGAAKADRGAVHEDEFARNGHRPLFAQPAPHFRRLAPAIGAGGDPVGDGANAVVEQRPENEPRPEGENFDQLPGQIAEAPDRKSLGDLIAPVRASRPR